MISMKLPNRKNATIKREKLTNYLLSLTHEKGKSKAKFFRGLGFNEANIVEFEQALLKIGQSNEVIEVDKTSSGYVIKYVIDGLLTSPSGKLVKVRTIWGIKSGEGIPELISAYPGV